MPVVVGIFPNLPAVSKLNDALKAAGLDAGELIVIADEAPSAELISSGVQFRLSGEPDTALLNSERGIITSSGGTEVPGLSGTVMPEIGGENTTEDLLADLNVPDGRTDDYEEALDNGRVIAGYATGDVDKVKGIFTASGANPIEVF
jgi:hypothetical protein